MVAGDRVKLVSVHHAMNHRLRARLGQVGVIQNILAERDEARVRFEDRGLWADWWVKLNRLEVCDETG